MKKSRYLSVILPIILFIIMLIVPGVYAERGDKKDENRKQEQHRKEQKSSPPPQRIQSAPAQKHEAPRVQQERPHVQQERKVESRKSERRDNVSERSIPAQKHETPRVQQDRKVEKSKSDRKDDASGRAVPEHKKKDAPFVKEKRDTGRSASGVSEKREKQSKERSSHSDVKREDRKTAPAHIEKKDTSGFKHERHARTLNNNERKEIHQKMRHRPSDHERTEARRFVGEERTRFGHTYSARFVPTHHHRVVLKRVRIIPSTYHYRRHVYYDYYGYVPPAYVYGWYPYYGIWDAVFLGLVLERAFDPHFSAFYYHHMYDPDIIRWRQENDRQAMENAELRAKLAQLDMEVARLKGTPRDDAYVPPDAEDLAISPDLIDRLN